MTAAGYIVLALVVLWVIAYARVPLWVTTLAVAVALVGLTYFYPTATYRLAALWIVFILIAAALNVPPLRRALFSNALFGAFRRLMPPVSGTEREALEAGGVWWEAEFFTGRPWASGNVGKFGILR